MILWEHFMERFATSMNPSTTIDSLLLEWQSSGDTICLERLIATITPSLERIAGQTLLRHGIRDRSAIDDATELVFDHLRRLPDNGYTERSVVKFDPAHPRNPCARGSSAEGYLHRLTHDRAIDVTRSRRRQLRRSMPFSQLETAGAVEVAGRCEATDEELDGPESCREATQRLHEAVGQLSPRQRAVIELLREGKSQVVIAHALGVCEGTVSRLRVKAIVELKRLMAE